MEHISDTNVKLIGCSLYMIIPAPLRNVMGIKKGNVVKVYREENKIIYEMVKAE
jgi:antitoxin component of MazEF toxin-antitoxin module